MKAILFITSFLALLSNGNCLAQNQKERTAAKYFSKIVIEPAESMFVETDTLLVDTLIMRDRATLTFMYKCVLGVSHAFIGELCQFNAAGVNGADGNRLYRAGRPGSDGRDLRISIRFEKLGSLNVLTNGGNGGWGQDGQNVLYASENGEDGGRGGDGGMGGNVDLFYLSPNFIVVWDEQSKYNDYYLERRAHAVFFNSNGGNPGLGGRGGEKVAPRTVPWRAGPVLYGNRDVTQGRTGETGKFGTKGIVRCLKTESRYQ